MRTLPDNRKILDRKSKFMQRLYLLASRFPFVSSSGSYNLTISHERKFIWFRVAKVGTRTIYNHLKKIEVQLDVEHAFGVRYPQKLYDDYFKFAFVRNPFDRLVSCWQDKVVSGDFYTRKDHKSEKLKNFEYFVDFVADRNIEKCDFHLRSQSSLIDLNNIDYLGRMETFDDDFKFIIQKLGLPEMDVVSRNVSHSRKHYHEYYSKETAEKVAQIYQKDLRLFGYTF